MKCRAWGQESVRISVIARVRNSGGLFQSFLYAFRRGAGVGNSEVSARRESTVDVMKLQLRNIMIFNVSPLFLVVGKSEQEKRFAVTLAMLFGIPSSRKKEEQITQAVIDRWLV